MTINDNPSGLLDSEFRCTGCGGVFYDDQIGNPDTTDALLCVRCAVAADAVSLIGKLQRVCSPSDCDHADARITAEHSGGLTDTVTLDYRCPDCGETWSEERTMAELDAEEEAERGR